MMRLADLFWKLTVAFQYSFPKMTISFPYFSSMNHVNMVLSGAGLNTELDEVK